MRRTFYHCVALSSLLLAGNSWAQVASAERSDGFHQAVEAARKWLKAKPADRRSFEAELQRYSEDFDAVIQAVIPRGSAAFDEIKGRPVTGDTFTVPELWGRNEDHPFNYYVPPHYDRAKPMGLILWMHGGGTYKPGKNLTRRWIEGKLDDLNTGNYIFVAAEACHGVNFPKDAVPDKMAGRWSVPASERYLADLVNELMHRYHVDPNRIVLWGYSMGAVGAYNHAMRTDRFAVVGIGGGSWTWGTFDTMLNAVDSSSALMDEPIATMRLHGDRSPQSSSSDISARLPTICRANRFPGDSLAKTYVIIGDPAIRPIEILDR